MADETVFFQHGSWAPDPPTENPRAVTATILLVDDRPDMLRAFRRQFARHAKVVMAANADEALAVLDAVEVTVILTDYQMPGRDGVDLLREVQRRWPRTRRFLMSGDQVPGIADLMAGGLVETFFTKVADFAAVVAVLAAARPD